jgi:tetratricopeptide (TPR) repeat protein
MQTIQEEHADDKVYVVGVAVRSEGSPSPEDMLARFPKYNYPMAIDVDDQTAAAFLDATRSSGLPNAMIIDREGRLAWVGAPSDGLDETLANVLSGQHDLKTARLVDEERHKAAVFVEKAAAAESAGDFSVALSAINEAIAVNPDRFSAYRGWQYEIALLRMEDAKAARKIADTLLASPQASDPFNRYVMASRIVHNFDQTPEHLRDLDLALTCAQSAVEKTSVQRHDYLALLATVHALRAEFSSAVVAQTKALEAAPEAEKPALEKDLEKYLSQSSQPLDRLERSGAL